MARERRAQLGIRDCCLTIPLGVTQVRIVLAGFGATDGATYGTVTFNSVGLFRLDHAYLDSLFVLIGEEENDLLLWM